MMWAMPSERSPLPPEASPRARRVVRALARPVERFLSIEASSGILLVAIAAIAMAWANSPWHESYHDVWHAPVVLGLGPWHASTTLHFVINDVLMTVFFFVVGLEIRRELHDGELADLRRAALPGFAALGGMLAPAAIFIALNPRGPGASGWGIPMATDIAFALGVLALLGRRVPPSLRVMLLALAIIDDIGAIVVIAVFYSAGVSTIALGIAMLAAVGIVLMQKIGVRRPLYYIPAGVVLWAGTLESGIHPTIAGVILGLLTPARAWYGTQGFLAAGRRHLDELERLAASPDATAHDLFEPLDALEEAHHEALSPVERLIHMLHPWVAYGIMPVFALGNAGVYLGGVDIGVDTMVMLGVAIGLVVGKPLGVFLACAIAVRLRIAALPTGLSWSAVVVLGAVAGIGFTMAMFVAELAFAGDSARLGLAKLAVLAASVAAAVVGLLAGRALLPTSAAAALATCEPVTTTPPRS
jgi:Na+:H+ antiporter, NhaA family